LTIDAYRRIVAVGKLRREELATVASEEAAAGHRTMGHVALHYGRKDEAALAARLLGAIGYIETQALPLPDGSTFYRFVVDPHHQARGDGIVFLSLLPPAQAAVVGAAREALGFGTDREHPAIAGLRAAIDADPEYTFHLGVLLDSLEELERVVEDLQKLNASDPAFKGRLKITMNRARRGDEDVDTRLDNSPIFGGVERYCYGRNGVQAFIETDILVSGPLADSMVLELDYVFPGKASHILSVTEL
jgi:GNAT superfamily N-acetyltransferase